MLLFSLFLHGVTFVVLFLLFQRLQESRNREAAIEEKKNEIEEMFQAYLLDLKHENEKFAEQLKELRASTPNESAYTSEPPKPVEQPTQTPQIQQSNQAPLPQTSERVDEANYQPPAPHEEAPAYEPTLESKVLQRYHAGQSADEIAKELDVGVTEIELMIKFHTKLSN